ncbi:MAG: lysozyme [Candidatus Nitrosocosmicus sp.]
MTLSLRDWLIRHEGIKQKPYRCTAGKLTIGVGRNLDDNGISLEECYYLLDNDIKRCKKDLENYQWYTKQPPGVKDALVNMCFNLGINRLLKFKKMILALSASHFHQAANEALDSLWAKQVGQRAKDVANMIRDGK